MTRRGRFHVERIETNERFPDGARALGGSSRGARSRASADGSGLVPSSVRAGRPRSLTHALTTADGDPTSPASRHATSGRDRKPQRLSRESPRHEWERPEASTPLPRVATRRVGEAASRTQFARRVRVAGPEAIVAGRPCRDDAGRRTSCFGPCPTGLLASARSPTPPRRSARGRVPDSIEPPIEPRIDRGHIARIGRASWSSGPVGEPAVGVVHFVDGRLGRDPPRTDGRLPMPWALFALRSAPFPEPRAYFARPGRSTATPPPLLFLVDVASGWRRWMTA